VRVEAPAAVLVAFEDANEHKRSGASFMLGIVSDPISELRPRRAIGEDDRALGRAPAGAGDGRDRERHVLAAHIGARPGLPAGHRAHDSERLFSGRYRLGQRLVRGIELDVLPANEEADERAALRGRTIADRPAQDGVARFESIEDAARRGHVLRFQAYLAVDARERARVVRESNADH
jgi:hypothetical protein